MPLTFVDEVLNEGNLSPSKKALLNAVIRVGCFEFTLEAEQIACKFQW